MKRSKGEVPREKNLVATLTLRIKDSAATVEPGEKNWAAEAYKAKAAIR
jgi:hypothetical protein